MQLLMGARGRGGLDVLRWSLRYGCAKERLRLIFSTLERVIARYQFSLNSTHPYFLATAQYAVAHMGVEGCLFISMIHGQYFT
jgi:hypothetical protein